MTDPEVETAGEAPRPDEPILRLKSFANAEATYHFRIAASELSQRGVPLQAGEKLVFDGRFEEPAAKPATQDLPLICRYITCVRRAP